MESKSSNGDSNANKQTPSNRRSNNNYWWNNNRSNNNRNPDTQGAGKSCKKPTFVGLRIDKVKAVVADESGLDPLSVQLERLEKEEAAYVISIMYAQVAKVIRNLKPFNFDKSSFLPAPLIASIYTYYNPSGPTTPVISVAKKTMADEILKSKVGNFVNMKVEHKSNLKKIYRIIEGNLDKRITTLLKADQMFDTVDASNDPIRLIKLLQMVCRKERGVDYAVNTFISSLIEFILYKQDRDTNVTYMY